MCLFEELQVNEANAGLGIREDCLLAAAKAGNPDAFEGLFKIHASRVFKAARRITRNHEDAEDASQESFVSAFIHLKSFDERSRFSTWLTRIAMNAALGVLRKKDDPAQTAAAESVDWMSDSRFLEMMDSSPNPEERYVDQERRGIVTKAVVRLQPRLREIVEFYHARQYSIRQTADLLGIPETTVKARLVRARRALRRTIPASVRSSRYTFT
jgi:RNA polymerase sigma-70 factor, ECF subfamily